VQKILHTPVIRLHGANLQLSKVPDTVVSSSTIENTEVGYNNDEIDQLLEATASNSILHVPEPSIQQNIPVITEPISIPSPE